MKEEVSVAVRFIGRLVERNNSAERIEKEQLEVFKERLTELLCERFLNHWFPDKPSKGQGYRCIRLNESDRKDAVIDKAANMCGLSYDQLRLPAELTIWVDPLEVCCRFGERAGSFCTLASFKNGNGEIFWDQVNLDEMHKKSLEHKEKVAQEMSTRKNGRRGFLTTNGSSPSYKGRFNGSNGYSNHHHPHHGVHPGGMQHHNHTPSPAAMNWYNSVNHSASASDMFSSSPPNHFSMYMAKFSPPKYSFGTSSKWSSPAPHPNAYGPGIPAGKGDKYHWFNNNKATIKA